MIDAFVNFCKEKDRELNIKRYILSGIIPSFYETQFENKVGTVMLINEERINNILNKSPITFLNSFLAKFSILLDERNLMSVFNKNQKEYDTMKSYYTIVNQLGYKFRFYFVFKAAFEYNIYKVKEKRFPNNVKYLNRWQNDNKINSIVQKNTKIWVNVVFNWTT
ncbi:hypothetical protein M9Y10_026571 [Tritrichomonas musculus]|uniref:Uncharacterized protein n=1 Tax=Tritrichomonas musculus TaxID=1915356 RepID=A0ABR2GM17_9EUKA